MNYNFEIFFWVIFALIFYTYIGYGIVLYAMVKIKRLFIKPQPFSEDYEPNVTLMISCYNELGILPEKIIDCFSLDYPKEKLNILFVTDGSNDGSQHFLAKQEGIKVMHEDARNGKIGAMNRGMRSVTDDLVIFTDANTMLNKNAIKNIVRHFHNPKVGCVAGEKRIFQNEMEAASGAGEGMYWKYESFLKQLDSDLNTVVGAAGELFAVRAELFEELEKDTLLDDFMISLRIAHKGYKVVYEKEAYAQESPSFDTKEELKRKIRISAGGIQSVIRLWPLLIPLKKPLLTWQYISHRVLRWTIAPLLFLSLLNLNVYLAISKHDNNLVYQFILGLQIMFYALGLYGFVQKNGKTKLKIVFVPFYFLMMNYAVVKGMRRYFTGSQSVLWEKAKRNL